MDIPFDPQLLSSPYYLRRPNTPGSQLSLQQPPAQSLPAGPINGLSMGMPMLQQNQQPPPPPHGVPLNPQQLPNPQQMRASITPGQPAGAPNSPSLRTQGKKSNRVLQLPAPLRSKANYDIPLPNDCEGLVYALEGNFDCGMEIVADAATRILEALTERTHQIQQAASCPPNANNPLRHLTLGGKLTQSQRLSRIKTLESSWVTSGFIADALVRNLERYLSVIELALDNSGIPNDCSEDGAVRLLEFIKQSHSLELEVISTIVDALHKWLQIWIMTGCLEKPKVSESDALSTTVVKPSTTMKTQSVIVENPPPPQPRGVGRPRLVPVISMADFVDNTVGSVDLNQMKPSSRPKVYFKIVRSILHILALSTRIFRASKVAANRMQEQLSREEREEGCSAPAFPIDLNMCPDQNLRDANPVHCERLIDPSTHHSILLEERAWEHVASDIFVDAELRELFLETVKEAEFLIWRENRRSTSSIEMTTSGHMNSNDRGRMGNELEAKDIAVTYPVIGLSNQLMCASLSCITALLRVGDVVLTGERTLAFETVYAVIEIWDICKMSPIDPSDPNTLVLPALFKSTGLHIFSVLLTFGRDYLTVIRALLGEDHHLKTELLRILCQVASHVMLSYGRFVVTQLFPAVPSALSYVLNQLAPSSSPDLPMDVQTCKSAVVMALVCLEELPEDSNWSKLWYGLLFSAYGSAVVLGRVKGFVLSRGSERQSITNDLRTIDQLLKILPDALNEKTCQLLKQKAPQIASKIPSVATANARSESHRDDDLDSSLQSQDASYLITTTIPPPTGPIDTYDESIEVPPAHLEVFQDILYACTNAFVGLAQENADYARFLRTNLKILEEIGLFSASPIICRLVKALEYSSGLMQWEPDTARAPRPAYILREEQLNS